MHAFVPGINRQIPPGTRLLWRQKLCKIMVDMCEWPD
jgi:hypothetical protein